MNISDGVLQVLFKVPDEIDAGLRSGLFERIGGVVRYADNKRIYAWLQENPFTINNTDEIINPIPNDGIITDKILHGNIIQASTTLMSTAIIVNEIRKVSEKIDRINCVLDKMMDKIEEVERNQFIDITKNYARGIVNFKESFFNDASVCFRMFRSDICHFLLNKRPAYLLSNFYLIEQSLLYIYTSFEYELMSAIKISTEYSLQIIDRYVEIIEKIFNYLDIKKSLRGRFPNSMERLAILNINKRIQCQDKLLPQLVECLQVKQQAIKCINDNKQELTCGGYIYMPMSAIKLISL